MALLQWAKGQLSHDKVAVSNKQLADIARPDINIVNLQRPNVKHRFDQAELKQLVSRVRHYKQQVAAPVRDPQSAAHELTADLHTYGSDHLISALEEDICVLVKQYAGIIAPALGGRSPDCVHVKLEVLGHTPCPRWHADHVTARLLCTYTGPGTWFVANRHVKRRHGWAQGQAVTAVASVSEAAAQQVEPTDLLVLKGHAWPGFWGLGAVHRSPLVHEAYAHVHDDCHVQAQAAPTELPISQGAPLDIEAAQHQHDHSSNNGCTHSGLRLLLTLDDARFDWMHGADGN